MIRTIKLILGTVTALIIIGFLHYTLPQHDIVRVTGSEIIRTDLSGWNRVFFAQTDSGDSSYSPIRDLRLINAIDADEDVIVYRNEDTGLFNWPPYVKVNSSNIHAQASDIVSSKEAPEWVIIRHYGWRNTFFSIYPNILSITPATGPDQRIIPWFNIFLLTILFAVFWSIFVRVRRFWNKHIEPTLDHTEAWFAETFSRKDKT